MEKRENRESLPLPRASPLAGGTKSTRSARLDGLVVIGDEIVFENALGKAFAGSNGNVFLGPVIETYPDAPNVIAVDDAGAVA